MRKNLILHKNELTQIRKIIMSDSQFSENTSFATKLAHWTLLGGAPKNESVATRAFVSVASVVPQVIGALSVAKSVLFAPQNKNNL